MWSCRHIDEAGSHVRYCRLGRSLGVDNALVLVVRNIAGIRITLCLRRSPVRVHAPNKIHETHHGNIISPANVMYARVFLSNTYLY